MGKKKQQEYTVKMKSPVEIDPMRWEHAYGGWKLKRKNDETVIEAVMPGSSPEDAYESVKGDLETTFEQTKDTWKLIDKPVKRTTQSKYVEEKKSKYYS